MIGALGFSMLAAIYGVVGQIVLCIMFAIPSTAGLTVAYIRIEKWEEIRYSIKKREADEKAKLE